MEAVASIIGSYIFYGIVGLAIYTFGGFFKVAKGVKSLNDEIKSQHKINWDFCKGGIRQTTDPETWAEVLRYLRRFNKIEIKYASIEQLIPVFPLLGILGTVSGLIEQLGDVEQMRAAMATSMWTTFFGLIAAIFFKCLDALWVSRKVNEMQLHFETYEQNYNMLRDKQFSENEMGSR